MEAGEALRQIRELADEVERELRRCPAPGGVAEAGQDVIAIPFFYATSRGRREITRRVFRHLRAVSEEVGARVIGVGSEGQVSRELWASVFDEVDYHEYPQTWNVRQVGGAGSAGLRAKFDETVRRARVHNPSRVFIGGSDDLIPMEWWREAWKSDADLIGVTGGAWIVNYGQRPEQARISSWHGRYEWAADVEFCGGGVVMGRELLDAWGWMPFRDPHCEIGLERRARAEGWKVEGIEGRFWAVKVQGAVLNPGRAATRAGAVEDPGVRSEWLGLWKGLA